MPRKKRQSELEDWIHIFAKLPWFVCLALTVPAYYLFAWLSNWPVPVVDEGLTDLGPVLWANIARVAGQILQYLLPLMLLCAAILSVASRQQCHKLLREAESISGRGTVLDISWREFEQLMHAWFERQGYKVESTAAGADGGVDLVARKGREVFLIQCKQWRAHKIGVSVLRELYGVMVARGAAGGFVVGVGEFTSDALKFAEGRNIELIDARSVIGEAGYRVRRNSQPDAQKRGEPECPRCGSRMVRRTARRGTNAGREFYGCSKYPGCRGTRTFV